jgi:hypothetical protein
MTYNRKVDVIIIIISEELEKNDCLNKKKRECNMMNNEFPNNMFVLVEINILISMFYPSFLVWIL